MAKKIYAVAVGREVGIFETWDETKAQVDGFKGAKYKSFTNIDEAKMFLETKDYGPKKASGTKTTSKTKQFVEFKSDEVSISTDAACSGNPGDLEYRFVWTLTKEEIFKSELMFGTNNIGEFLGLVHTIRFIREKGLNVPIYTDSKTAIAWVRDKDLNTTFDWQAEPSIKEKVEEALEYIRNNPPYHDIRKWETTVYGDIPADFGRK